MAGSTREPLQTLSLKEQVGEEFVEPREGNCTEKVFHGRTQPIPSHPALLHTHPNCQIEGEAREEGGCGWPTGQPRGCRAGGAGWRVALDRQVEGLLHSISGKRH